MLSCVSIYYIQKRGNTKIEYEDAFYPIINNHINQDKIIFALSDGATEGMHSKKWAQILVKTYCKLNQMGKEEEFLNISREIWKEWKKKYIKKRELVGKPLQWFEELGFDRGASATFLGIIFSNKNGEQGWNVVALGDTCLVQVRAEKIIQCFPIKSSNEFNNSPLLLSSNKKFNNGDELVAISGDWQIFDIFFLMTDALACWFLKSLEDGETPIEKIYEFETNEAKFYDFVEKYRDTNRLKNDDVTLIIIRVLG